MAAGDAFECWSVLAALAVATSSLRIGSLVSPVTFHRPVLLAKRAATVDHISGGRAVLGIGPGWQVTSNAAIGVELASPRERADRFARRSRSSTASSPKTASPPMVCCSVPPICPSTRSRPACD